MAWGPLMPHLQCFERHIPKDTHRYPQRFTDAHMHPPSPAQPHNPSRAWVGKAGHTAQRGLVSGLGRGMDGSGQSGLPAGAHSPVPKPGQLLQSWVKREGEGYARALQPALPLAQLGVTILDSFPRGRSGTLAASPGSSPRRGLCPITTLGPKWTLPWQPRRAGPGGGGGRGEGGARQPDPLSGQRHGCGCCGQGSSQGGLRAGSGPRQL